MRERLETRLEELRAEAEKGHKRIQELEQELSVTRDTVLRIMGAIQVLEEELGEAQPETQAASSNSHG